MVRKSLITNNTSIIRMCEINLNERKRSEELKRTGRIGTNQFDDQKEQIEMVWTC